MDTKIPRHQRDHEIGACAVQAEHFEGNESKRHHTAPSFVPYETSHRAKGIANPGLFGGPAEPLFQAWAHAVAADAIFTLGSLDCPWCRVLGQLDHRRSKKAG